MLLAKLNNLINFKKIVLFCVFFVLFCPHRNFKNPTPKICPPSHYEKFMVLNEKKGMRFYMSSSIVLLAPFAPLNERELKKQKKKKRKKCFLFVYLSFFCVLGN